MPVHDRNPSSAIAASLDRMPFSPWHVRLLAVLGTANLFDALDATAIAFVLPSLVGLWSLTPAEVGLLIAAGYAGQLLGAVLGGVIAGRFGRIATLRLSLGLMSVFSLLCALAPHYGALMALRFVQGVGLGGLVPVAATYLNEVCPSRFRGRMVNAIQLMFATGALLASLLAVLLIPRFGWPSMFIIGTVPIILALTLHRILPESPRWLAISGDGAWETALAQIERVVDVPPVPDRDLAECGPDAGAAKEQEKGTLRTLFAGDLLRPTLSAWIIAFCTSLVTYGLIGWMPTLYRTVYNLTVSESLVYSLANGIGGFVGVAFGVLLIDRLGRKTCLILGFAGAGLSIMALWTVSAAVLPITVASLSAIAVAFLGLPSSGIYVYAPEIYPTGVRALGTGLTSAWIRIAAVLGPQLIGFLLTFGAIEDVYLFLGLIATIGAVATAFLAIETAPGKRASRRGPAL